jgi:restriction system protein
MLEIVVWILVIALIIGAFVFFVGKSKKSVDGKKDGTNPEMNARMAMMREKKAQLKIERQIQEEKRIEEQKKREEEKNRAISKLGLVEVDNEEPIEEEEEEYFDGYGYSTLVYQTNEYLDIDRLFKTISKFEMEDESIKVFIQTSSDSRMYFAFNLEENVYFARMGEGPIKKFKLKKALRNFVWCFCENERISESNKKRKTILLSGIGSAPKLQSKESSLDAALVDILTKSDYSGLFEKRVSTICENDIALIEYELPSRDDLRWVKDYKFVAASNTIKETPMSESSIAQEYEHLLYSICLRSVYEVCAAKNADNIKTIVFNGFVTSINRATGIQEKKCILSLQVSKERFLTLDLKNVDPKKCFKSLKGVSAAQLIDVSPVQPVMTFNKNDRRLVEGREVQMNSGTNLASMDWEDFEHLVRELFEMEFSRNGGEVHVTQASRDGGVDAIVFDPDPLRGGKIVIQAKRYTNTVGVSAVRDLYGTVINEGANSGILITTSDYGHDSYEFAKDKPLKLLNGGHLLSLLHKNGKEGYINIQEAKETMKESL